MHHQKEVACTSTDTSTGKSTGKSRGESTGTSHPPASPHPPAQLMEASQTMIKMPEVGVSVDDDKLVNADDKAELETDG